MRRGRGLEYTDGKLREVKTREFRKLSRNTVPDDDMGLLCNLTKVHAQMIDAAEGEFCQVKSQCIELVEIS